MRIPSGTVSGRYGVAAANLKKVEQLILERTSLPMMADGTLNLQLDRPYIVRADTQIEADEYGRTLDTHLAPIVERMDADSKLQEYYTRRSEADRLGTREGHLEHVRSKELIARYLPEPPMRIIDIGGGTGSYASWLASLGYDVHLVDVVDGHVEEAASVGSFTATVGDARALEASDDSYDGALVLGPLYHLPKRDDRLPALREVVRVVKPGGVVIAAFISRLAIPLDAYVKGWIDMERGLAGLSNAVRIGHDAEGGFGAIAYFHLPTEISPELLGAGLEVQHVLGVEGPGWIAADFDARWADAGRRQTILDCARQCEALPELLGLSLHIIAIARNP